MSERVAVVVILTEGAYQPKVLGPFPSPGAAWKWASAYDPRPGEVVHVVETTQP